MILCGIPKDGDGYRCPYCGFKSTDLDDFAVSMCWSCAFGGEDDASPALREEIERQARGFGS